MRRERKKGEEERKKEYFQSLRFLRNVDRYLFYGAVWGCEQLPMFLMNVPPGTFSSQMLVYLQEYTTSQPRRPQTRKTSAAEAK
jgi:hypothetical protein